ncbi:hypothetical protein B0H14DRAFT_3496315 [Mycena olivaceomarginata]|nr:hypothetical protein B0H14DRAFT_3496315 [Mycena olivaceomarginata]
MLPVFYAHQRRHALLSFDTTPPPPTLPHTSLKTCARFARPCTPALATLYRMARLIIAQNAHVQTVSYALPNKHCIVDMGYLGVENLVPAQAEVFMPIAAPSGLITATVSRK